MSLKNLNMTLSSILYNEKRGVSIENSPGFLGSRSGIGLAPDSGFSRRFLPVLLGGEVSSRRDGRVGPRPPGEPVPSVPPSAKPRGPPSAMGALGPTLPSRPWILSAIREQRCGQTRYLLIEQNDKIGIGLSDHGGRLGEEARSLAEILTPASFGFFGGEYLARISNAINMIIADITGMCLPVELRSGILAGRKTRLPEKTEPQRRDFLTVATPSSPSPL